MAIKPNSDRLAVMIDADNAQATLVQELMSEVSRYGTATIKRAYGDWTTPNLAQWKGVLHSNAIQPVQQFRYTTGKNATDSALIIDAMDVLHSGVVDGFCLVSSDSDFTRLATRIREAGLAVYGFGERHTPEPFVAACDKFVYTEILRQKPEESKLKPSANTPETKAMPEEVKPEAVAGVPKLKPMVLKALEVVARDDGWATLSSLGSQLGRTHPSFDSRNYGVAKLGDLMRKQNYLETKDVPAGENSQHVNLYVRRKPA
ncbi:NYN domain-containing protein [Simplicispira lacusdiani]|uniref:NYN domain-containing protein n=1 Tax=Simplicispira lacusdiani TaxID=2213010 RepID=UPI000E72CE05|nr:NYN domain-containing protein [Simplicispira lacusdiani]